MVVVKVTWPVFKNLPNHIFVIGKATKLCTANFVCCLIHRKCTHDILHPKGICSEARDFFEFWEISHNILLKVHRYIVAMENWKLGNRTWPIEWHHCQCP